MDAVVFVGFDWSRYLRLRPALASGDGIGSYRTLEDAEAQAVIAQLPEEASGADIANCVLAEVCAVGTPVMCRRALADLVKRLQTTDSGEAASELLTELALGRTNIEPWFQSDVGLIGLLTPAETRRLREHLNEHAAERPVQTRRGGLAGVIDLMRADGSEDALIAEIRTLAVWCAAAQFGMAALTRDS